MPEDTPPKPSRAPQALSSEYHKARKQLMIWAGILFIWELVGIDLDKAKETGGNAGALITAIKSPQAIPWVLVVLVAYFVFKLGIEWSQCEMRRRETLASRLDVGSAWVVAFLACILYAYQAMSRTQVADIVQGSNKALSIVFGVSAGIGVVCIVLIWFHPWHVKPNNMFRIGYTGMCSMLFLISIFVGLRKSVGYTIVALLTAVAICSLPYYLLVRRTRGAPE